MRRTSIGAAAVLASALAGGCSGDVGASCGTFAACGGDVVGIWNVAGACSSADGLGGGDFCPGATADTSGVSITGKLTYRADMTYETSMTFSGQASMTLPASCLMMGGVTITCASLEAQLKGALTGEPDSIFEKVTCTGSSSCTCTVAYKPSTQMEAGKYSTSGNVLSTTPTGDSFADKADYCVKGTELDLASDSQTDMGMAGRSYIVARK